jgi:hypothetical protein
MEAEEFPQYYYRGENPNPSPAYDQATELTNLK